MFGSSSSVKYALVLSIENGSASGVIVASNSLEAAPSIVYATQRFVSPKIDKDGNVGHMRDVLKNLAADIEQNGRRALALSDPKARLHAVVAVCAAPFALTVAHKVQFEDEVAFTIDAKLLKDLQKAAESQSAEDPEELQAIDTRDFQLVERAVVDTKINGYDVEDPIGVSGTLLDLTLVSSFISKELQTAIEEIAERIAPDAVVEFATQAFSTYCVLRDVYPDNRTFGFVYAGRETTEMGMVQKDALLGVSSAAYGTETLLRAICEGQQIPAAHIRSKLCLHQEGMMDDDALRELEGQFESYLEQFENACTPLVRKHAIPRNIFILTVSSFETLLSSKILEALKRISGQSHVSMSTDRINIAGSENIHSSILCRFFHKLHQEGRI